MGWAQEKVVLAGGTSKANAPLRALRHCKSSGPVGSSQQMFLLVQGHKLPITAFNPPFWGEHISDMLCVCVVACVGNVKGVRKYLEAEVILNESAGVLIRHSSPLLLLHASVKHICWLSSKPHTCSTCSSGSLSSKLINCCIVAVSNATG